MKHYLKFVSVVYCAIIISVHTLSARSIHRPSYKTMPCLETCWKDDPESSYQMRAWHLELSPLFYTFDKNYFEQHLLPSTPISYRNKLHQEVSGKELNKLIEGVVQEIKQHKKTFTHFVSLRESNFNRKRCSGLIVLKCKKHPFIVKLFMETPHSFVRPYSKGFEPFCFYFIGGGVNRHLTGFTRIKNLEVVHKQIAADPYWSTHVDVPRKWFWVPEQQRPIILKGKQFSEQTPLIETEIPSIYGIVADAITAEKKTSLFNKDQRTFIMNLCNFVDMWLDPHIDNFMIEKDTNKIVIIDTEHFPTVVGFKDPRHFSTYSEWFVSLMGKFIKDFLLTPKSKRAVMRTHISDFAALSGQTSLFELV